MTQTFTKKINSVSEYNDAVNHANALGFEVAKVTFWGSWQTSDGEPVFISGANRNDVGAGYKYLTTDVGGQKTKLEPSDSYIKDAATIEVKFSDA